MGRRIISGVIALGALAATACNESGTGPSASDQVVTLDVAMVAADGTLNDLETMRDPQAGGPLGGLERLRTVTYYDAAGTEQAAFDEATTDYIHIVTEISGAFERESWSATVSRLRDMTISGLEGDETARTVNGSGSEEITRSRHSDELGTRTYEMSGTSSIVDVVHGVPLEGNPYPLSGMITRNMTVSITGGAGGDETRTRSVVVTFDGTQFATMTVDGETFEIDLAVRDGQRPMRGGPGGR